MARRLSDAALLISEERNRLALLGARMGTWDHDAIAGQITWSAETEALHGLAPGTFERSFAALRRNVHPQDWPAFATEMKVSLAERRDALCIYRAIWADGSVHWLENRGRAVYAADDTLLRVIGTTMDITERKQNEEALRASEGRYRTLFEFAPDGILIADSRSYYLDANATICQMLGYTREEVIGLHGSDIVATSQIQNIAPALEEISAGPGYHHEWQFRRKDGSTFDAEVIVAQIPDGTLLAMIRDVTQRKQAEEELRASEERFRKQYKSFPLPTYSWLQTGDDFVLEDYNDAAMVGGDQGDILGLRASTQFALDPMMMTDLRACIAERRTSRRESRYHNPCTDRDRDLAITCVFVPPRTVMIHTEDVTDVRQAERQQQAMAQSEKLRALGQMASGIAHDLNQSLMLVASYNDLAHQALMHDPPNLAELGDLLTTATQAAIDGGETVKRLLLFTRAAPDPVTGAIDLAQIVREGAQLTAPHWRDAAQAEGRPISMHIESEGHPTVLGSASQLRELMTNLIFNAVDAMPAGGTIRLRVAAEHGRAIVEVIDSGVGMSAEVRERVFEPFFTTKGDQGTGLGLAMVFGIVEQHGGSIDVRSAPGEGSTLRVSLPLLSAPTESASPARPPEPESQRPLRVLVVDDEPMMTRAVVRMLKPTVHVVSVAASGEEALLLLAEHTFDVVVSDMGMGAGMNGWELADAVRSRWPAIRFMLATGWGAAIDSDEARAKGVEAVLAKPYLSADLLRALAGGLIAT